VTAADGLRRPAVGPAGRFHLLDGPTYFQAPPIHISLNEARVLDAVTRALSVPGPIVEIGTLFGFSTNVMAIAKSEGRELITVDNYSWNPARLSKATHRRLTASALAPVSGIRLVERSATDFFAGYSGPPPALVFIDAAHSYEAVRSDIEGSLRIGASVICGHDYDSAKHPGVVQAVDELGGYQALTETFWVLNSTHAR